MKRLGLFALLFCICSQALGAGVALFAGTNPNTLFYANSTTGNDSNNGSIVSPWATIAKVNAQTFGANTEVFLSGTFTDGLVLTTTVTPGSFILTSYGSVQATISTGNSTACVTATNVPNVTISGVTCTGGGNGSNTTNGIKIINNQAGNTKLAGPTIANNIVSGYGENCIFVVGQTGSSGFTGFTIRNNTVHDCTGNVDPGSVPDTLQTSCITVQSKADNGSGSGTPAHTNGLITGNTAYNCTGLGSAATNTGDGITCFECGNSTMSYNLVHDSGGSGTGAAGIWTYDSDHVTISYNEVYNMSRKGGGSDGDGFDCDAGTTFCLTEYNYAHDNVGYNYLAWQANDGTCCVVWGNNTWRFNIGQNAGTSEVGLGFTSSISAPAYIYRNTLDCFASGHCVAQDVGGSTTYTATLANNIFMGISANNIIALTNIGTVTFAGNDYWTAVGVPFFSWNGTQYTTYAAWQSATGQEKIGGSNVGQTVNPQVYVPDGGFITGGYVPASLMNYNLQAGSAMLNSGVNLQSQYGINLGGVDYYGATVAAASTTIGAAEGDFATFAPSCAASTNFLGRISSFNKLDNVNYNSLLCGLNSDGNLSHFDAVWALAAPNSAAMLLNLVSTNYSLTSVGGITFTARQGTVSNGTTGIFTSPFTPSTAAGNYVLNSASIGAYDRTSRTVTGGCNLIGVYDGIVEVSLFPLTGGGPSEFSDINEGSGFSQTVTQAQGFWAAVRSNSTTWTVYQNGNSIGTFSKNSVALPTKAIDVQGENNNGAAGSFCTDQIALAFIADGAWNVGGVNHRVNAFMIAYGINVY